MEVEKKESQNHNIELFFIITVKPQSGSIVLK